jgi:hypothetical protein
VVVCPSPWPRIRMLPLHLLDHYIAQLWAKTEMVDLMREGMRVLILEVVLQIVDVQVAVRERLSGGDVEVSYDLIDADTALETASFLALLVEVLGVVFALALFYALAAPKRP